MTFAALFATLCLAGCATLDHGTVDDIPVATDPPGAKVSSSSGTICISPCLVLGGRKDPIAITITKPGYVTQTVMSVATPNADAISAASALTPTPDLFGRVVDVQDGALYTHVPKAFVVTLVPAS